MKGETVALGEFLRSRDPRWKIAYALLCSCGHRAHGLSISVDAFIGGGFKQLREGRHGKHGGEFFVVDGRR